jgi:para-nitrobenzyl esterase
MRTGKIGHKQVVRVNGGLLTGLKEDRLFKFYGIPYATPPTGELRWREPQPLSPWSESREAHVFGPISYQIGYSPGIERGSKESEDCLYLNIWTPSVFKDDGLPVMVWIHGGGFMNGSGSLSWYDGTKLAQEGIVLVTINYRLGPLGNLVHPELEAESKSGRSGNYGVLDQIAALEWVQENVSGFGGNPQNITIFGQSVGAMSAALLCSSPRAKGLFHKAICQSGGMLMVPREIPYDEALQQGLEMQKALRASSLKEMREIPAEKLISLTKAMIAKDEMPKKLRFAPIRDDIIIRDQEKTLRERARVPLIIGSNKDEATFFKPRMQAINIDYYKMAVKNYFGDKSSSILDAFHAGSDEEAEKHFLHLHTYNLFTVPAYDIAGKLSALGGTVYIYRFNRLAVQNQASGIGVSHGEEIPYVFGHTNTEGYTSEDHKISEAIMKYWIQFAKMGNPNRQGLPVWPRFTLESNNYLAMDDEATVKNYFDDASMQTLLKILK